MVEVVTGGGTPRIPCHLWEPLNHHGHAYRRGGQEAHCPGRNRPGMPWVSAKSSKAAERAETIAQYWRDNGEVTTQAP